MCISSIIDGHTITFFFETKRTNSYIIQQKPNFGLIENEVNFFVIYSQNALLRSILDGQHEKK